MPDNKFAAWQLNNEFSSRSAASLILGISPHEVVDREIEPVLQRMRNDYESAVYLQMEALYETYDENIYGPIEDRNFKELYKNSLRSNALIQKLAIDRVNFEEGHEMILYEWLRGAYEIGEPAHFDRQVFSREEILKWLKVNNIDSVFPFDPKDQAVAKGELQPIFDPRRTPHRTSLMDAADQASARFWGENVRAEDHDTHPTNPVVAKWLVDNSFAEKTMAAKIASIIRPSWAHKGKPKKD